MTSQTRVKKGVYLFDKEPSETKSIQKIRALFAQFSKNCPPTIAAQYAGIPTTFPGIEEEKEISSKRI